MQDIFVQETILTMNPVSFEQLKKALLEKYISFHIMASKNVTKEILAEKLHDYFEKVQYNTHKKFDDLIKDYVAKLDAVVKPHVAKTPNAKKGEPVTIPRSRKYYEKAAEIGKSMNSLQALIDYTRLMMCLYAEFIKSGEDIIDNLDFAVSSLDPAAIVKALKAEKKSDVLEKIKESSFLGKAPVISKNAESPKARFNTSDPYNLDSCFFVIAVIMLYTIKGGAEL